MEVALDTRPHIQSTGKTEANDSHVLHKTRTSKCRTRLQIDDQNKTWEETGFQAIDRKDEKASDILSFHEMSVSHSLAQNSSLRRHICASSESWSLFSVPITFSVEPQITGQTSGVEAISHTLS